MNLDGLKCRLCVWFLFCFNLVKNCVKKLVLRGKQ